MIWWLDWIELIFSFGVCRVGGNQVGVIWVGVCVTGHQYMGYVQIMSWWSSNLGQWPRQNLGSVAYCYISIIGPPHPILPFSGVLPGWVSPPAPTPPPPISILSPHRITRPLESVWFDWSWISEFLHPTFSRDQHLWKCCHVQGFHLLLHHSKTHSCWINPTSPWVWGSWRCQIPPT